jgi:hypothetical protein
VPRAERPFLADALDDLLAEPRVALDDVAPPRMCVAVLLHPPLVQAVVLDRQQACLVRPVLEDAALAEQARHRLARVVADAGADRDPVAAVDGRDRVQLDAREAAYGVDHVVRGSAPRARCVALPPDDVPA